MTDTTEELVTDAENHKEKMDMAIRLERRGYFNHNPPNTWLAQVFNDLLEANGTFERDLAKNNERERAALESFAAHQLDLAIDAAIEQRKGITAPSP